MCSGLHSCSGVALVSADPRPATSVLSHLLVLVSGELLKSQLHHTAQNGGYRSLRFRLEK